MLLRSLLGFFSSTLAVALGICLAPYLLPTLLSLSDSLPGEIATWKIWGWAASGAVFAALWFALYLAEDYFEGLAVKLRKSKENGDSQ